MVRRNVKEPGLGRIAGRLLILGAKRRGADILVVDVLALGPWRKLRDDQRAAIGLGILVHVDLCGPVHNWIVFLGDKQFAGFAVERVGEAIAVEMNECFPLLSALFCSARIISFMPS